MKIVTIIPTYNEKESIVGLLETLFTQVFPSVPQNTMSVLVVDGNSPDGTAVVVEELRPRYPNLHILKEKEKRGLGAAYCAGMREAIGELHADAVIEFDGDGQHNPDDIPRLVAEFEKGFDLVIGSRYVEGGSVPREWALWRKFLSRFGSLFAKLVLSLPTRDNTSGFKLTRVKGFAENLPKEESTLLSRYYAYKIQFLHELIRRGAKTKEVPIHFLERERGTSKSTLRDLFDSLRVVFILRFPFLSFPRRSSSEVVVD